MEHRISALEARWDAIFPTLATKADLAAFGADLRLEFREGLQKNAMETAAVRTEMQKLSADIKTWTLATVLTIIGTMLAAIIGISQVQKATPPAPIVITVPAAK
jgi:hypothetical protein